MSSLRYIQPHLLVIKWNLCEVNKLPKGHRVNKKVQQDLFYFENCPVLPLEHAAPRCPIAMAVCECLSQRGKA